MNRRVVVTGATGTLGRKVVEILLKRGDVPVIASRDVARARASFPAAGQFVRWNAAYSTEFAAAIDGSDAVIHLAGASIARRWTSRYKQEILGSRVRGSESVAQAILAAKHPPQFLFSASAIGYYGEAGDAGLQENSPAGEDFLADVCRQWEAAAKPAEAATRVVYGRTGIVLDKHGGALAKMLLPFRLFAGGALGSGEQWWSWVHHADVTGMIFWAMDNPGVSGAMNICSPNPVKMRIFADELARGLHRPSWLNVPAFALKLLLGEMAITALGSQKVLPQKASDNGYIFLFPRLNGALADELQRP